MAITSPHPALLLINRSVYQSSIYCHEMISVGKKRKFDVGATWDFSPIVNPIHGWSLRVYMVRSGFVLRSLVSGTPFTTKMSSVMGHREWVASYDANDVEFSPPAARVRFVSKWNDVKRTSGHESVNVSPAR